MPKLLMSLMGAGAMLMSSAFAQDESTEWSLDDLAWLEGCWEGPAFDGFAKECWVTGPDGHMTGLLQLEEEGKIVFTEIFHLADFEEGPSLRVKHFNADMTGWEEKDGFNAFKLQRTEPGLGVFSGLTLRLEEDGRQTIELVLTNKEGERWTETIVYERVSGPAE